MNHLSLETSPYLLQHKNNPVDWYPWGFDALERAKNEDKLIILSIGYSACHWCHVMEHESFESEEVAKIMNTYFVCIKVDREERPDLDGIYMEALQNMGQRGGWPLNVFLLPDTKPFYGGTYFPKASWINLLLGINDAFKERREELESSANGFVKSLQTKDSEKYLFGIDQNDFQFSKAEEVILFQKISKDFDGDFGGMRRAPKFPMPSVWNFLLDFSKFTDNEITLNQLKLTLERIALGGIFDHLAGGWTRYSTDERWKVPHFEKMLYDNGQLLSLYANSYLFFNSKNIFSETNNLLKWAVEQTITWVESEMKASNGGFYSALDADAEGIEGKYYVWERAEIEALLGVDSKVFCEIYDISKNGNWEHQNNILHLEIYPVEHWELLKQCHQKLSIARSQRVKCGLDDKILTGWNGLMLTGFVDAYRVFGSDLAIDLAKANIEFIDKYLIQEYRNEDEDSAIGLLHQFGERHLPGYLDDYSAIIEGFLAYYQVSFEEKWLFKAESLLKCTMANFYDDEESLFYFTDVQSEKLIARKKEIFDNVIPASNSKMAKNLYFLGRCLSNNEYLELSQLIFTKFKPLTLQDPQWLSNWADLGLFLTNDVVEITVSGTDFRKYISEIQKKIYNPNIIYFGAEKSSMLPVFEGRIIEIDKTNIYVCINHACHLPVLTVDEALILMNEAKI